MSFRPEAVRAGSVAESGTIDYRLARQSVLTAYRKGRLGRHEVCDAHPELARAAGACGEQTTAECPICEDGRVVLVNYVFGPRLPKGGLCVTSAAELAKLSKRQGSFTCYVVEVCPSCRWNHLARTFRLAKC